MYVVPPFRCADAEVARFVASEIKNISPYSRPDFIPTWPDVYQAALQKFGKRRVGDLLVWEH